MKGRGRERGRWKKKKRTRKEGLESKVKVCSTNITIQIYNVRRFKKKNLCFNNR